MITVTAAKDLAPENMFSGVEVSNAQAEVAVIETVDDLQSTAMNICDDTLMETEQTGFKVLLKRKKSGKAPIVRHAKKKLI